MILDTFDHAFVLNLDQARAKYTLADQRLRAVGIVAERFPAIVPRERGPYGSVGARGCTESHAACVKLARERGYQSVLIFEDDVVFRKNFGRLWQRLQPTSASLDWDLLYFYQWKQLSLFPINPRFVAIDGTFCTHAYAVQAAFYGKMLAVFQANERIGQPVDFLFNRANARICAPTYNLAGQDAGTSAVNHRYKHLRWSSYSGTYCGIPVRI